MPGYDPNRHHRRSIRLKGYDYTQAGAYFVTICVYQWECLLGDVRDGEMVLSEYGRIVQETWDDLPNHYPHMELDAWVIMPNHVHGIIVLTPDVDDVDVVGAGLRPAPTKAARKSSPRRHDLPEIVRALKSFSARRINQLRHSPGVPVWQRNYYERIIRTERALQAIRQYILDNPIRWHLDRYNPKAMDHDPHVGAAEAPLGLTSNGEWNPRR